MVITEHRNHHDRISHRCDCWMAQGRLGETMAWEMADDRRQAGLEFVAEMPPNEANRVTLADELEQSGLWIPRITDAWSKNDGTNPAFVRANAVGHGDDRRCRHLPPGGWHQPSGGHGTLGLQCRDQRGERRLPQVERFQPLNLRRLSVSDH